MRTEEVLNKIPELKKDELYFWRKRGFIRSQVVQDGRAKRHEWDLEEVQKIQLIKELCISGLSPKEAYRKATEDFLGRIKVIAIGDAGCNILQRLNRAKIQGVQSIAVNTDAEALMRSNAHKHIQIGKGVANGIGLTGDWKLGAQAAEESSDELRASINGANIVFIIAGMGGGTGTGAAPLIAELVKKSGALTIAILIKPFTFEGETRKMTAEMGITQLKEMVDALIEIPNDRILSLGNEVRTVDSAFKAVDNMVKEIIEGITELIQTTGEIDISYSDVRTILHRKGPILISTGSGTGKDRAIDACQAALSNPLIDASMLKVATKVLFNITGPSDLLLKEVNDAVDMIKKGVGKAAEVIFGVTLNSKLNDEVKVILFAVGNGSGSLGGEQNES